MTRTRPPRNALARRRGDGTQMFANISQRRRGAEGVVAAAARHRECWMRRKARLLWLPLFDLKSYKTRSSLLLPLSTPSSFYIIQDRLPLFLSLILAVSTNRDIYCLLINTAFHPSICFLEFSALTRPFTPIY